MEENQPTTKQIVIFTVVLSFVVSIIGSTLAVGLFGGSLLIAGDSSSPFVFNRPRILERIIPGEPPPLPDIKILPQEEVVVGVVERSAPAVFSVVATKDVPVVERFFIDPFGDSFFRIPQFRQRGTEEQEVSAGTGFFVSDAGVALTNKHVVADKEANYTVLLNDGRKLPARVLARDPVQDIAVLKVDGSKVPFLKLGDSARVRSGSTVIAIGNALGEFRNTVSVGVVSGLHRSITALGGATGPESLQELIQTDAAINPGNSGGPLLNLQGEVVGMNTAIAQGAENVGFAIPIEKAKKDIEEVKRTGKITVPFLGVRYVVITKEFAEEEKLKRDFGVLVGGVTGTPGVVVGSPAAKAGLKEGDIILEFNGETLGADKSLATLIQDKKVGDEVTLKIFRDDKEIELKATLTERE